MTAGHSSSRIRCMIDLPRLGFSPIRCPPAVELHILITTVDILPIEELMLPSCPVEARRASPKGLRPNWLEYYNVSP